MYVKFPTAAAGVDDAPVNIYGKLDEATGKVTEIFATHRYAGWSNVKAGTVHELNELERANLTTVSDEWFKAAFLNVMPEDLTDAQNAMTVDEFITAHPVNEEN
jgi:hypothetical protein